MDSKAQAEGEKRVRDLLIGPLEKRGLGVPTTLTKDGYAESMHMVAQMLAYMTPVSLEALMEICAAHPGGPKGDRMPIANFILDQARRVQPPANSVSPLMRAVFKDAVGQAACRDGWGPELLDLIKEDRRWPRDVALKMKKRTGRERESRFKRLKMQQSKGRTLMGDDKQFVEWRAARHAAVQNVLDVIAEERGAA